jgi:hypothetical protein
MIAGCSANAIGADAQDTAGFPQSQSAAAPMADTSTATAPFDLALNDSYHLVVDVIDRAAANAS